MAFSRANRPNVNELFAALGDPLIKGLTEVANARPDDPISFLASYLYNFANGAKNEESTEIYASEEAEVENEVPAPRRIVQAESPPPNIDVVTVEPGPGPSPDAPEAAFSSSNRDEHGQSMLHFAAARSHGRNALFQLLQESEINLGYRDELYRTARDVSIQANISANTKEIDKWLLHLAAKGNKDGLMELLMEGYDHILDVVDTDGSNITELVAQRGQGSTSTFLASIPTYEESRENFHQSIRAGDLSAIEDALSATDAAGARMLAIGKNSFGRCSLHIAVLFEREEVVEYIVTRFPETLRLGDNLERTALHYAMGVENVENLSKILIKAGAKRVLKDLKGRQPSYYYMNKSEILRLKEEEESFE